MQENLSLTLSQNAAKRIAQLRQKDANPDLRLRVTVLTGGCSGFQYQLSFDDQVGEDDKVFSRDGVEMVIDTMSLPYLAGSEIDYVEELSGSFFQIRNPQAKSSCGCGGSFSPQ
ncbi:MAG: iron-sulfur cluster insertion protein ErpA [Dongiaceae bacterium]